MTISQGAEAQLTRRERWRTWRRFLIVAAPLLMLKLLALLVLSELPLVGDEIHFWQNSEHYLETYWSRPDPWSPFQFVFIALIRAAFGAHALLAVRVIHLLVHTASAALILLLGRELEDDRTGLVAALLFLVLPEVVSFAFLLYTETWAMFWFLGATVFYLRGLKGRAYFHLVLAGLLLGMAAEFRNLYFFFLPLFVIHLMVFMESTKVKKAVSIAALVIAMSAPLSLQTVKHYRLFHEVHPCGVEADMNYWLGHNFFEPPDHNFYGEAHEAMIGRFPGQRPRVDEPSPSRRARIERDNALRFIAEHPGLTVRRTLNKLENLFHPSLYITRNFYNSEEGSFIRTYLLRPYVYWPGSISYMLVMLAAIAGLIFAPERKLKALTLFIIGFHLFACGLFFGITRFRMGFMPLLIVFAAWAVGHAPELWRRRKSWRGALTGSIWLIFIVDWAYLILSGRR